MNTYRQPVYMPRAICPTISSEWSRRRCTYIDQRQKSPIQILTKDSTIEIDEAIWVFRRNTGVDEAAKRGLGVIHVLLPGLPPTD